MSKKSIQKSKDIAYRIIDSEAVIVTPTEQKVSVLNQVGSRIWDLLDGKRDCAEIARIISEEFDVSFNEALSDIERFIEELKDKNLIEK